MQKILSSDGTPIAFERSGKGPPVILIGGALCDRSARASGTPLAALLASRLTVFSYDRRGRGDSGDTAPYSVAREVDDVAALIAEAGGSAYVYGISSGAMLALEVAAQSRATEKVALYEPPFVKNGGPVAPDDYLSRLEALTAAGRRGDAVELFLTQAVQMPAEVVAQMRRAPFWPSLEALGHTVIYDATIVDRCSSLGRFAEVAARTLVLAGASSPPWMRNAASALAASLPRGEHRLLEGQTHDVAPEVLARALLEFFAA